MTGDIERLNQSLENSRTRGHLRKIARDAEALARAYLAAGRTQEAVPLLVESINADLPSSATEGRFCLLLAVVPDSPEVVAILARAITTANPDTAREMVDAYVWDRVAGLRHAEAAKTLIELERVRVDSPRRANMQLRAVESGMSLIVDSLARRATLGDELEREYVGLVPSQIQTSAEWTLVSGLTGIAHRLLHIADANGDTDGRKRVLLTLGNALVEPGHLGAMVRYGGARSGETLFTQWDTSFPALLTADMVALFSTLNWNVATRLIEHIALRPMPFVQPGKGTLFMNELAVTSLRLASAASLAGEELARDRLFRAGVVALNRGLPPMLASIAARALADYLIEQAGADSSRLDSLLAAVEEHSRIAIELLAEPETEQSSRGLEYLRYLEGVPVKESTAREVLEEYLTFRHATAPETPWKELLPRSFGAEESDVLAVKIGLHAATKADVQLIEKIAQASMRGHRHVVSELLEARAQQMRVAGMNDEALAMEIDLFRSSLPSTFFDRTYDEAGFQREIHAARLSERLIDAGVPLADLLEPVLLERTIREKKGYSTSVLDQFIDELRARALLRDVMTSSDPDAVLQEHEVPLIPAGPKVTEAALRLHRLQLISFPQLVQIVDFLPIDPAHVVSEAAAFTTAALQAGAIATAPESTSEAAVSAAAEVILGAQSATSLIADKDPFVAMDVVAAMRAAMSSYTDAAHPDVRRILGGMENRYVRELPDPALHDGPTTHVGVRAAAKILDLALMANGMAGHAAVLARLDGAPLGRAHQALAAELIKEPSSARSVLRRWVAACEREPGDVGVLASGQYVLEQIRLVGRGHPEAVAAMAAAVDELAPAQPLLRDNGMTIGHAGPELV